MRGGWQSPERFCGVWPSIHSAQYAIAIAPYGVSAGGNERNRGLSLVSLDEILVLDAGRVLDRGRHGIPLAGEHYPKVLGLAESGMDRSGPQVSQDLPFQASTGRKRVL
jgi:hypothetical protein